MERLGMLLLLGLGLVTFAALAAHFNSGTTRAVGLEHVQVVNSTSDPVPVTGTVKAAESGPWKVGIDGTPKVSVASTPPVNVTFAHRSESTELYRCRMRTARSASPLRRMRPLWRQAHAQPRGVLVTSTPRTPARFLPSPPLQPGPMLQKGVIRVPARLGFKMNACRECARKEFAKL